MGDIADMMLDGSLCEGCGVYMGEGIGLPRRCVSCERDDKHSATEFAPPKNHLKIACSLCGRHVKAVGLGDHLRDKHGVR